MRIRTVKPEFWTHPVMARLPAHVQLLALSLLSMADDHGYFHADPAIVRGAVAPFREGLASVSRDLAELAEVGWIDLWDHPEQGTLGQIRKWSDHQKIDRPSASKIAVYDIRGSFVEPSRVSREGLALDQGSGIRDQGKEVEVEAQPATATATPGEDDPLGTDPVVLAATAKPVPQQARPLTIGDIQILHPKLLVTSEDRDAGNGLLRLYGPQAWLTVLPGLDAKAATKPRGKQRVFVSDLREALSLRFEPDAADYERAGLPVPQEATNA